MTGVQTCALPIFPTTFNVTIDGTDTYSTTTGTVTTGILSDDASLHDIVISNPGAGNGNIGYFSETHNSWNVSNDISSSLQRYPLLRTYRTWDNAQISIYNWRYTSAGNTTFINNGICVPADCYPPMNYTNADLYLSKTTYQETITRNINLVPGGEVNGSIHQATMTLRSLEKITEKPIYNWSLWYQGINYSTTNESITIYPNIGTFTFNWSSPNGYHPPENISITIPASGTYAQNLTGFYNLNLSVAAYNAYSGMSLTNISGWEIGRASCRERV